ncbi:MAG: serine/threonine-protein kinase [Cyanobacteria bacterium P01_D01_bin.56]
MDTLTDVVLHQRYKICSKLSQMPGSKTFLATDLTSGNRVVVKLLLFDTDFTWENLKLFERETAALKDLNHPAIPAYLDFDNVEIGNHKGFLLVQTYIDAPSLQDWVLRGRTFSEAELKQIAKNILNILAYLHHRQPAIIHRDIKPSNVLLTGRSGNSPGQVYLVDFGAIQGTHHGGTVTVVGTYGYMPLEQFGGRAVAASDLYSLGATLVYLATGQHPTDLPQQDLRLHFADQVHLSASFSHWLQWLLEPDLRQRPESVKIALKDFDSPPNRLARIRTSMTNHQRPQDSKIGVEQDSDSFVLRFPLQQMGKKPNESFRQAHRTFGGMLMQTVAGYGCALIVVPLVLLSFWVVGLPYVVLGILVTMILCSSFAQPFSGFSQLIAAISNIGNASVRYSLKLTFQANNGRLLLQLCSQPAKGEVREFFCQRLVGISAGPYGDFKYRINFVCDRLSAHNFHLQGSQQEIQWLCYEISRWTGWEIGHRDVA